MSLLSNNPLINKFWKEGIELQPMWFELFENLGVKFDYQSKESEQTSLSFEFLQVFNRYSESHRFYHTPRHLLECLKEFEEIDGLTKLALEVPLALWFHDVVYDTKAKDNEEKSEQYAQKTLQRLKLSENRIKEVGNLILLTKHSLEPMTFNEKLILDIDLSIFGKPKEVFDEYESNIRKEYSWVSEENFKNGRKKVLESFLNRNSVYRTDFFKNKYETQARMNLALSIKNLEQ